MKILITREDLKEAKKLGFKAEINGDDYTVEVDPENPMDYLKEVKSGKEAEKAREAIRTLGVKRQIKADRELMDYNFETEGVTVVEGGFWEYDGADRLTNKFYYEPIDEEVDHSIVGSFIVDFKKGTDKVEDVHVNLYS